LPELPEIEHLANELRPRLLGRRIEGVRCRQPKMLNLPEAEFAARAAGEITAVSRRGKSCILHTGSGGVWLHLGLGAQVQLTPVDENGDPQLALTLSGGEQLTVDKTFMGHAYYYEGDEFERRWNEFGPDPLDAEFTVERLGAVLSARPKQMLKALLMDQARLAGIGNTYSDEILHRARLHPRRAAGSLKPDEVERLHAAMRAVLREATAAGGEESFLDLRGEHGRYEMHIHGVEACLDCGTPARRESIGGRTAYFCPRCQPEPA
jgi:formamidopyrimidine-DNA glycosylase